MSVKPLLSICVPSRNRQIYFQQTISDLRASLRTDIEFVFADNSDDPSIMNAYMKDVIADPRVVYLPSTGTTLSMVDNWERTMEASTGDYIVFIGDDDYVDPEVAEFLKRILAVNEKVDAVCWRLVGYTWPYEGRPKLSLQVPFDDSVVKIEQADLYRRMFGWFDTRHVPTAGFSIYHSAISRSLMERIKRLYGGRYFEHPIVDYDNSFKVICTGSTFVATARAFGVMGSCPLSNSFAVGNYKDFRKKIGQFIEEAGRDYDEDLEFRKFPFRSTLGTTSAIGVVQNWFKNAYNIEFENWGEGFAKACALDCENYLDREAFDSACEGYRTAFTLWEDGKYLPFFKPVYNVARATGANVASSGFNESGLFIDQDIPVKTPAELFAIVRGIITPVDMLDIDAAGLKFNWQTEDKVRKMLWG